MLDAGLVLLDSTKDFQDLADGLVKQDDSKIKYESREITGVTAELLIVAELDVSRAKQKMIIWSMSYPTCSTQEARAGPLS